MLCFVVNILRMQADCSTRLRIIWFVSYQNFSIEYHVLSIVTEKWRTLILPFFKNKTFHLLKKSHKSIKIPGCGNCKKILFFLPFFAAIQRRGEKEAKIESSAGLKRATVKCMLYIFFFSTQGAYCLRAIFSLYRNIAQQLQLFKTGCVEHVSITFSGFFFLRQTVFSLSSTICWG